ncbi:MAG: VCBS repeat-containing protein [Elusimicrobiota bacterium]|nr:VCBS repeat-containing protein [Elusimicrobiota bacterium]
MIAIAFSALLTLVPSASAATPAKGYVVRAEDTQVWLDLTAADGAAVGRGFQVYEEGEDLKHPVTGEQLGRAERTISEGTIEAVADKHSVGRLPAPSHVQAGQRARLKAAVSAPVETSVPPASARRAGEAELRGPRTRGASLPFVISAMVVADFDGAGKPQVVLADEKTLRLYAYPAAENKVLAQTELPGTGVRVLSLESGDLDGDKKAELFVSLYNEPFRRLETWAFKLEAGQWVKTAEIPFLVRAHQNAKGERVVAAQQIQDDKTFPFAAVYPLVWQDGKYVQGRPKLNPKRADWVYGFTYAQLDAVGEPASLYLTSVNSLRAQFAKGHWRSTEGFGQSPHRVRWHDKLLEVHPPMLATYGDKGFDKLYIIRNLAMLGGLANPFGLFNGGEVHAKTWTGVAFETAWKAELGGASAGFALVEPEAGRKELAVAVAGSTGKSAVWTFDP